MKVGVLALQGGVTEHLYMARAALSRLGVAGEAVKVKRAQDLTDVDGLILPGGESTAMQRLMARTGLWEVVKDSLSEGLPAMGTCAGAILLARAVKDREVEEPRLEALGAMNVEVVRNYFGRQRESFEVLLEIPALGGPPFKAVFIRAPAIIKAYSPAKPLAWMDNVVVAAEEEARLATVFHPELGPDIRLHEYWIQKIRK